MGAFHPVLADRLGIRPAAAVVGEEGVEEEEKGSMDACSSCFPLSLFTRREEEAEEEDEEGGADEEEEGEEGSMDACSSCFPFALFTRRRPPLRAEEDGVPPPESATAEPFVLSLPPKLLCVLLDLGDNRLVSGLTNSLIGFAGATGLGLEAGVVPIFRRWYSMSTATTWLAFCSAWASMRFAILDSCAIEGRIRIGPKLYKRKGDGKDGKGGVEDGVGREVGVERGARAGARARKTAGG